MRHTFTRLLGLALCCYSSAGLAQDLEKKATSQELYSEGRTLFEQKAYSAAIPPLRAYLQGDATDGNSAAAEEAAYMLACAAYELGDPQSADLLRGFLAEYPDTPHANRIQALIASTYFFDEEYEQALQAFGQARLEWLAADERDDMTYRLATCYLLTGDVQDAAIWFETLRATSPRYAADCTYYLSYIRYTQQRYDEALKGFLSLQEDEKYEALVPYYIAEIYLAKQQYDKAEIVAQNYLSAHPADVHAVEMQRVLGTALYHYGKFQEAMKSLEQYAVSAAQPRRDACYMLGMACYRCGVYSKVPEWLGRVTLEDDALAQNAYLHMGLAYLQMSDTNKARMAFEQAAVSEADRHLKEQAAYNYALCIHETAYSAFGESVAVFENFLNEFPSSVYADKVSSYLVDVYMSTRSYEAALQSIERIKEPNADILRAKTRILFQLGTQAFANADFAGASARFRQAKRLASALGSAGQSLRDEACYWEGEAEYRLGHLAQAAAAFDEFLSATSQRRGEMYALAYYNLGYIAFHQQNYAAAESRFASYVRLETGDNREALADAYNRLGDCCLRVRRFDEAKQYYATAEKLGMPSGDYSYYQQALVAGLQKDYGTKVTLLDELAEKYPDSPYAIDAMYEKGRSFVQSNQRVQAIATFRQLVEQHPESPVSRKAAAEIGLLYYQDNDYDKAVEAYTYVVTRYPGSEEARLAVRDLKSIYVETNRVDQFAQLMAELPGGLRFEAGEQDSLTYVAADRLYMKGEAASAQTSLEQYLQKYPDGAFCLDAHYRLCVLAKQRGDEEGVLSHAGKLLEYPDNPYSEEALLLHAEVLFNRKQYEQALADYRQLQTKATTPERRRLGIVGEMRCAFLLPDQQAIVVDAATRLLAESSLTPELKNEALYDRAKAYLAQGDTDKAVPDLKLLAADTRTLQGAEAKYRLAQLLYDKGEYAAAEKEVLDFIEQSTPHAYWLARSFVLLSDVYVAMDKKLDARQYLLSLQQNYQEADDIQQMIDERLEKLK
ncbi:MAG TPA: tetratricopeptide repeat protein [Candidatus Bacteroides merdipullorum]|uniref:Tetratricopeptide repeat protein n=1 Tax=Candidatus Bacteroides merdipullorum TaxID=2838474 RepID=A0A9D2A344_9BACE|nr:tetratricopeptide repeat protein [Candidatus Bacteroides merdipullorum]